MQKWIVVTIALVAAGVLLVAQPNLPAMGSRTVVVELFTSQG